MPRNYGHQNWLPVRRKNVCGQQRDRSQAAAAARRNPRRGNTSRAPYALGLLSTKHKIKITPIVSKPKDEAQIQRLKALHAVGDINLSCSPDVILFDCNGNPKTGRFADWLQKQITIQGRDVGGPYTERITPVDHYWPINQGKPNQELVPLDGIDVEFWVDGSNETIAHHAIQLVVPLLARPEVFS